MENVVPGHLQRLRAADIIRMAGLAAASVGQEYYRAGAVHSVSRRGAILVGIVELPSKTGAVGVKQETGELGTHPVPTSPVLTDRANDNIPSKIGTQCFPVEVECVETSSASTTSWVSRCTCSSKGSIETTEAGQESMGTRQGQALPLCAHGAALLYQWLAQPSLFQTQDASLTPEKRPVEASPAPVRFPFSMQTKSETVGVKSIAKNEENHVTTGERKEAVEVEANLAPTENLLALFSQSSLSDLRAVAREYGLVVSGMSRQQLVESIQAEMQKTDVVRRVAATLEKSQRQFLAALILAGGAMSDDDLRGLFERFSLGQPSQLQHTLLALQGKALLFRTSLSTSNIPLRHNHGLLNNALLDIGWYVPLEVRHALRVSIPVTPFNMNNVDEQDTPVEQGHNILHHAQPSGPLPMLLLVARLLDGYTPAIHETWYSRSEQSSDTDRGAPPRRDSALRLSVTSASGLSSSDGSVAMPSPEDLPPSPLLQELIVGAGLAPDREQSPAHSQPFLRFVVRVLGVTGLLQRADGPSSALSLQSGAAEQLLGTNWAKVLQSLFKLWLTETSYGDLYDLTEEHLRLRCRAHVGQGMHHQPILRSNELDAENRQARQYIVALLAQAPLNQWMNFTSFARFVYRLNPLFLQRRQSWGRAVTASATPQWWLEVEEGRPLRPLQLNDWLRAEFIYLRRMIAGPLHWWGACDIVTSTDGTLLAFRLTPMATRLFNIVGVGLAPSLPSQLEEQDDYLQHVAALDVTDSCEILVPCSVQNWSAIQLLELFTEATGVMHGLLVYRISAKAFGFALGRGLRPLPLLRLLRLATEMQADSDAKKAQLFTRIATQFEQWLAGYSRVRLYTGVTLLETVDVAAMREVVATTSLEASIVKNIHPTLCIVKPHAIGHIVEELKQRGQSPLLHDEDL